MIANHAFITQGVQNLNLMWLIGIYLWSYDPVMLSVQIND